MGKKILIILSITFLITNAEASDLLQAVKSANPARVKMLLDRGADLSERDETGHTALMWAATQSNLEIVTLISQGLPAAQRHRTFKPTMWRSEAVYDHILRLLLHAEKNPRPKHNTQLQRNQNRNLITAIISGNDDQVRNLLQVGADPNAFDRNRPALISAAFWGHQNIVSMLLDAGAKANLKDDQGFTARMWAEERGHTQIAAMFK